MGSRSFRRCTQIPETTSRCFELSLNITDQMAGWLQTSEAIKDPLRSGQFLKRPVSNLLGMYGSLACLKNKVTPMDDFGAPVCCFVVGSKT